jgi:hypothetical protein
MRRDQLPSIMPALQANRGIPSMLFMLNNPIGSISRARSVKTGSCSVFPVRAGRWMNTSSVTR